MRAKDAEAQLLDIAREEARQRRKSEEEVVRLTSVVNDGYSKIASVEAMAQQLQESMNLCTCTCVLPWRAPDTAGRSLPLPLPCCRAVRAQLRERDSMLAVSTTVSPTSLSATEVRLALVCCCCMRRRRRRDRARPAR